VAEGVRFCPACGAAVEETRVPGQERKLVTVLFADLTGSTGLGERMDPEQLKEIMDAYFEAMATELRAEGGTVEKFIGDAVMAAFGVPAAHEDDPTRALRAALRMRAALEALNRTLERDHGVRLSMGIGVNTGEVVAFSSPNPGRGMVVGDPVNVAARLEQGAEPGQILVSERAARGSRGFRFRAMGPLQLKGKDRAVHVVELLGREDETEPGPEGLRPPIVGRDRELSLLQSLYQRVAAEGRPHLLTVYGEAGVGKSRLLDELEAWLSTLPRPPRVLSGRCLPYGEGVTYWPLAEIVKREAGVVDNEIAPDALRKIDLLARRLLGPEPSPDPAAVAAALAFTVGLSDQRSPLAGLDPRHIRLQVVEGWASFLSAVAGAAPCVLVIEDAHWADQPLLDLLEELADRVQGPILFVCSARPELTGRRPGWGGGRWNFSSVLLEPLAPGESDRLLGFVLSGVGPADEMAEDVREAILDRSGGNPFFLEEIARHLVEEKQLASGTPVRIPDTVQGVLAARMDLLGPTEKRVLQSAAVVGKVFWLSPVGRLLNGDGEHLDEVLERLRDRGLILARLSSSIVGEREFSFKHVLTRDVAYESLPRRDRAVAHARVAEWIEASAGERRRELVELLAHHYSEAYRGVSQDHRRPDPEQAARLRKKAFGALLTASGDARRKLVVDKAIRFARSAVDLAEGPLERSNALEALGEALVMDYQGEPAWEALTEALELRLADDDGADDDVVRLASAALDLATRARGIMRSRLSRDQAQPYLDAAMARVGDGESEALARLLMLRSYWPYSFREPPGEDELRAAMEAGERAADIAMRLGRPDVASMALDGVGSFYKSRSLYGRMESVTERRLALAPDLTDPWEAGDVYATAAWAEFHTGRYRRARDLANEGFRRTRQDAMAVAMHCLDWRAVASFRLGDWDALMADAALAREMLGERRDQPPGFAADHIGAVAFVHEVRGEAGAADQALEVLRWLEETEERPSPAWMTWVAVLMARRGAFDEGRDRLRRAESASGVPARGLVLEAACDVLSAQEAWAEVRDVVTEARVHSEAAGLLALPAFADRADGLAAAASGDHAGAVTLLDRARATFHDLGASWEEARSALALAGALVSAGRAPEGRSYLSAAAGVFDRTGSLAEATAAEALAATST
jgi:class 3 adenylate cyclase/tetratricopeptide (TPR) repeat protein